MREAEQLNADIRRLRSSIDDKLMQKTQIQGYRMSKTVYTTRPRKGWWGGFLNAAVGDKRESHQEFYTDNTDADRRRSEMQELIDKDNNELSKAQNEKAQVSDVLKNTDGAVENLEDTISQQSQLRQQAMRDQEKLEKRQDEIENYQVQAFQEKLKNEVRTNVRSFVEDAGKALNEIKSSVNDIVARLMQNSNERLLELQDKKTEILLMQTRNESEQGDEIARREAELKDAAIILDATNELI